MAQALEESLTVELSPRVKGVLREAYEGHAGQFRVSRNSQHRVPFIVHPVGVAKLAVRHFSSVQNVPDDLETVVCVALAHDLLEDTRVVASRIEEQAGPKVKDYVEALTKPPAGIAGRTGEQRNQELLRNILRAGPTAVFIKICDNMHNLGSPAFTPIDLLAKTIAKAKCQYMSLLNECSLGAPFRAAYLTTIADAEKAIAEEVKFARAAPTVFRLEDAIRECVAASAGKVLEIHDITAILKRICATESVGCWRLKNSAEGILEPVAGMGAEVRRLHWPAGDVTDSARILKGASAQRFGAAFCAGKLEMVVTVPFRTDADTSFVMALGLEQEIRQTWINENTASLLVQFLAHRLILSEADRRGRLASEAADLGLQLRSEIAAQLGVQPSQLAELQRWRSRCEQAVAIVSHAINLIVMSEGHLIPLAPQIRIETRVKTVDSLMLKMLRAHVAWPNYESVEDLAGVRVICPTQADVAQLEHALLSPTTGFRLHAGIEAPRRDYVTNPTSDGYRALHLILEVKTLFGDEDGRSVPCELQLRTMFQDTWAKISHDFAYQAGPKGKRHSEQLRNLSATLRAYEESAGQPEKR